MGIASTGGRQTKRRIQSNTILAGLGAQASLTTAITGTNNDLKFTANQYGTGGNSIRVRYVVSGNNAVLAAALSGNDITVTVATNGSAAATSTAAQVKTLLDGVPAIQALITTTLAASNDGTRSEERRVGK